VRNILDFPGLFQPPARIITLEQNYRSVQPILDAANAVIVQAREQHRKELGSTRGSQQKPFLAMVRDELGQVDYVVGRVLENREAGLPLNSQAVLFRAAHHSAGLEVELGRRRIPFVKYGGLRFLEAAHIKDVLAILRWAENPRDRVAAFRVLQLLPGIGPGTARKALAALEAASYGLVSLTSFAPPPAAAERWPGLIRLLMTLSRAPWPVQLGLVRQLYDPLLEELYDFPAGRRADLGQLERLAAVSPSRQRFLTELTLDPPEAVGREAGPPVKDEDYLVLSTIHSAKGQEWRAVFVLNCVDGCIPSDLATGSVEEIEEERRLLYVAVTRARDELHLVVPQRFYAGGQARTGDRYVRVPAAGSSARRGDARLVRDYRGSRQHREVAGSPSATRTRRRHRRGGARDVGVAAPPRVHVRPDQVRAMACWLCSGRGARSTSCGLCLRLIPDRPLMILAGNDRAAQPSRTDPGRWFAERCCTGAEEAPSEGIATIQRDRPVSRRCRYHVARLIPSVFHGSARLRLLASYSARS
jgi:hypothetical protein